MKIVNKTDNKGFTVMELILAIAISAFVILAAYTFVFVGLKSYQKTREATNVQTEMSFAENTVGEIIREAVPSKTKVTTYSNGNVEIYTQNKVVYYAKNKNSIYVFNTEPSKVAGTDAYKDSLNDDNLVTEYATGFSAEYLVDSSKELETAADGSTIPESQYSNVIKVKLSVTYKGKKDKSEVKYYMRSNG